MIKLNIAGRNALASKINDFFGKRGTRYDKSLAPNRVEQISGLLAIVLMGFIIVAVVKGMPHWHEIPFIIWPHLVLIMIALALTPIMLLRRRGDKAHRALGWIWTICMFSTAVISLGIRLINHGGFSPIHLLSLFTILGVPVLVIAARRHDIARHRGQARGFVIGALLVAGFFTFPFNRLLGSWLFG